MTKPSVKKRLLKIGLLTIFLLVVLPSVSIAAYGGLSYYQAKNLAAEANSLVKVEKFDQAIEKYALAEAKWSPQSLKDEIRNSLEKAQRLKEEKELYEKGVKYFDEAKWESAKEAFEKIADTSKYYEEAQEKLKTIAEKIETEEKAKAQVRGARTSTSTPAQTPTPTETTENLRQICENEMNIYKNRLDTELMKKSAANPDYQRIAQTPLKAALDAEIKRQVENAAYQFFNDCLAGKKRLKDMTY